MTRPVSLQLNKFALCAQCEALAISSALPLTPSRGEDGRQNIVAHLAFLFVCVTWGASFILMERATHAFGPVGVAIGRLVGGAAVLAIVWWVQRGRHRVAWADLPRIAEILYWNARRVELDSRAGELVATGRFSRLSQMP